MDMSGRVEREGIRSRGRKHEKGGKLQTKGNERKGGKEGSKEEERERELLERE